MTREERKAEFERTKTRVLARLEMERQVREELRSAGVKVQYCRRADIMRLVFERLAKAARPCA
jgi:hypothetical protein